MKKIFFLVLLFILSSCAVSKELKEERISWDYNNWDKKYKERALSLCIMKGYENEMVIYKAKLEEHKSKSFFSKIFADEPIEPEKPIRRS